MALDAKFNFDANACSAIPRSCPARSGRRRPAEVEASKFDLAYISLDGNIGCLVNGAGQPWPPWTPSSCSAAGQLPGCGRRRHRREGDRGLQDHAGQQERQGILVNIFGGIMKCDTIATGVITACKAREPVGAAGRAHEGHERRAGQETAGRSGLPIIAADTMAEAATKIVAAVK